MVSNSTAMKLDDLETTLSSLCYPLNPLDENDDLEAKAPLKLLAPTSSWSVMLDIREVAKKSAVALEDCSHSLRLFSYNVGSISFVCQSCRIKKPSPVSGEDVEDLNKGTSNNKQKSQEISKGPEEGPDVEATDSDDDIDQLLIDTPEKEKQEIRIHDEIPTSFKDSSETDLTLSYPEVQKTRELKLKPLSELLEISEPEPSPEPELLCFSSRTLDYGVHPMQNIPLYQPDTSLTEGVSEATTSYNLPHSQSSQKSGSISVLRPTVGINPGGAGQVRLVRASTVLVRKPPPAHSQFQQVRGMAPGHTGQSQQVREMAPGHPGQSKHVRGVTVGPQGQGQSVRVNVQGPPGQYQSRPPGPPWPSANQLRAAPFQSRVRMITAPQRYHQVGQRQPLHHDPRLPAGWSRIITMTGDGTCSVSILDSGGRVYRSREELRRFLLTSGQISLVDPNKIDFSVFGQDL